MITDWRLHYLDQQRQKRWSVHATKAERPLNEHAHCWAIARFDTLKGQITSESKSPK